MLAIWLLGACRDGNGEGNDDGVPTDPIDTDLPTSETGEVPDGFAFVGVAVHPPDEPKVYLVQQLDVETNLPSEVTAAVSGPDGATRTVTWPTVALSHQLPLVGLLADTAYSVVVTVRSGEAQLTSEPIAFTNGGIPARFPEIEVLVYDVAIAEPGYLLAPPFSPGDARVLTVLDGEGRPVWAYVPARDWKTLSPTGNGTVVGLEGDAIRELDWLGREVRRYETDATAPTFNLDFSGLHHELVPLADGGFYTLSAESRAVVGYPLDYDFTTSGDVTVANHLVQRIGADGTTLETFSLADLLAPTRIGFDSLDLLLPGSDYDWVHANGIVVDASDDSLLVSSRHQDAIVKIDRKTSEVVWIFGQPDGWPPEFQSKLFTKTGADFQWPGHQHAPFLDGDTLLLFDNGNNGRANPYSDANRGQTYSRVVQYTLDEQAQTATLDWEFSATTTGELYSLALGNADRLPITDNVLATFSYLHQEGDVDNEDIGRGNTSTRLIEFAPETGETRRDLRLYSDLADAEEGWLVDRAVHLPSLYGTTATETLAD